MNTRPQPLLLQPPPLPPLTLPTSLTLLTSSVETPDDDVFTDSAYEWHRADVTALGKKYGIKGLNRKTRIIIDEVREAIAASLLLLPSSTTPDSVK